MQQNTLKTVIEIDVNNVLTEYPRPQMVRDSYLNLNGIYDYTILNKDGLTLKEGEIIVPFPVESQLSGVMHILQPDETLRYKREFTLKKEFLKDRLLLHFGAVDYIAKVFINGKFVGTHKGGYLPFEIDITNVAHVGVNVLEITVTDPTDTHYQARGKQTLQPQGIWYTSSSGIWQTVWLESVCEVYVKKIKLTPDIDKGELSVELFVNGTFQKGEISIFDDKNLISKQQIAIAAPIKIAMENYQLWTPDNPKLYGILIEIEDDKITSYFAMRKHSIGKDKEGIARLMLNNKPYFHNGLLDQGYFPDGLITAPTDEALASDIVKMKELGFNMLRKHIKIEPLRWYYHCDRLGMLVWQDAVNGGGDYKKKANIFAALAFLFPKKRDNLNYKWLSRGDKEGRDEFETELKKMIEHLYNVASISVWVPFNESWGQFDAKRIGELVKTIDPTRIVDHASGWYDQNGVDLKSLHVYFVQVKIKKDVRPIVLSEFGGYSCKIQGHVYNEKKCWGYKTYDTPPLLNQEYANLFYKQIIPLVKKGLSATVYTQLSDVENEVNGLLTYDRKICKMDTELLLKINRELIDELKS